MDPFKDCQRLYTKHFEGRLEQRYIPSRIVEEILRKGTVSRIGGSTYTVSYHNHRIILVKHTCRLAFKTIFKI